MTSDSDEQVCDEMADIINGLHLVLINTIPSREYHFLTIFGLFFRLIKSMPEQDRGEWLYSLDRMLKKEFSRG